MGRVRMMDTAQYLAGHVGFNAGNLVGVRCYRLSGPPVYMGALDAEDQAAVIEAVMRNRRHYLSFCRDCEQTVTFDHRDMRVWVHEQEALADHVAVQASHENHHQPPPDGMAYVVFSYDMPIAWVLNDGTIVTPSKTRLEPRQTKHQAHVLQHLTPGIVTTH